jgi:DNA primase
MAERKAAKKSAPAKPDPDTLRVQDGKDGIKAGMTDSQVVASVATRSGLSATTLKAYTAAGDFLSVTDLMGELRTAGDEVVAGDMGRIERIMTHQVITLNAMFNNLAQRSSRQEYMKQMETYLRLALKAQAQCRSTAEALALLKNPQPYIKQANIAQGHQQINNTYASASAHSGMPTDSNAGQYAQARAGAGKTSSMQNKLLAADYGQGLDIGAQGQPGQANPNLEAVEARQRAAHA